MLPSQYQEFIHLSRYARWNEGVGRRETWDETVDRYFDFFVPYLNEHHDATISDNRKHIQIGSEIDELSMLVRGGS